MRTVSVALQLLLGKWEPQAERAARSVDKIGAAATMTAAQHKRGMQAITLGAGVAATAGALALGKIVSASMNFDRAMSGVAAVSKASATELNSLREAALRAGADTVFSASQAAQAEGELAKAGVSTADILGGALRGSLDLAAAGQLDLADAASISAQAMNIWKLSGRDVGHIADVLAAGANKSAADVDQLGAAMRQSGLVAAQLGVGMEDTVGVLAAFADRALVGTDAGTSLKTMLQRLASPTAESSEMMRKLGINAFDASGQFVGMEGFAGQLQSRLSGLTQEQRTAALSTIFGSDAIRAANVLYEVGGKGVREYTTAVNDQGAASRMAATQLDNLAGDIEAFSGSVETALIKSGSGANAMLRGITQGATGAVNAFSDLPGPVQSTAVGLLAVGTAGLGALAAFGTLAPKIRDARASLESMGRAGEIASASVGKIGKGLAIGGAALVGVELLAGGIRALQSAIEDTVPGVNELTTSLLAARVWGDISKTLGDNVEDLGKQIRQLVDPSVEQSINRLGTAWLHLSPRSLDEARAKVGALDQALSGLVSGGHGEEASRQFDLIAKAAIAGGASVDQVREALPLYREALAGVKNETTLVGKATAGAAAPMSALEVAARALGVEFTKDATAAGILGSAIDRLNGANLSALGTNIAYRDSLVAVGASLKDNGRTLDINTAKGRVNLGAVAAAIKAAEAHAQAVADQTGSVQKGNAVFGQHVGALRRVLLQAGLTKGEVDRLIATYGRVPAAKATKVTAPGAATAKTQTTTFHDALRDLPARDSVAVDVNIRGRDVSFPQGRHTTAGLAAGGKVPGVSPSDRADDQLIRATAGEYMIQRPTVQKVERQFPGFWDALNAGQIDIGGDPGTMIVAVGRKVRQVPKFATGGQIQAAQSWMRAQAGEQYVYGGHGPNVWDCSGYAGGTYAMLTGRNPNLRYFTTVSIGAAQGFRPGKGTFTIGVTAGEGHMAFNLAGLKGEATPPRVRVGAAAAPVTSFARQFYLPSAGGVFGGMPGLTERQIHQTVAHFQPRIIAMIARELGVGVRRFDDGGWLPPHSATLAVNDTRHWEPVGPAAGLSNRGLTPAGPAGDGVLVTEVRALRADLRRTAGRGPLVHVDRMELRDGVDVDLLAHRLGFAERAGSFT